MINNEQGLRVRHADNGLLSRCTHLEAYCCSQCARLERGCWKWESEAVELGQTNFKERSSLSWTWLALKKKSGAPSTTSHAKRCGSSSGSLYAENITLITNCRAGARREGRLFGFHRPPATSQSCGLIATWLRGQPKPSCDLRRTSPKRSCRRRPQRPPQHLRCSNPRVLHAAAVWSHSHATFFASCHQCTWLQWICTLAPSQEQRQKLRLAEGTPSRTSAPCAHHAPPGCRYSDSL